MLKTLKPLFYIYIYMYTYCMKKNAGVFETTSITMIKKHLFDMQMKKYRSLAIRIRHLLTLCILTF